MESIPTFGNYNTNDETSDTLSSHSLEEKTVETSKYTLVDNLDSDPPIAGQEYALFSFLSPEGIMNCNVRAVKFRGAFPTLEKAQEYCKKIESHDKYFKIFVGETGKWLEFDPPVERVDREITSNQSHQQLLDHQRELRMKKINDLAGKYKSNIDKNDKCKSERSKEVKKTVAVDSVAMSNKSKQQETDVQIIDKNVHGIGASNAMRDHLRMKLQAKKNKIANKTEGIEPSNVATQNNNDTGDNDGDNTELHENIAEIRKLIKDKHDE